LAGPVFSFLSTFNRSELSGTKLPVLADLFLGLQVVHFDGLIGIFVGVFEESGA
jgi:hypothetical protein